MKVISVRSTFGLSFLLSDAFALEVSGFRGYAYLLLLMQHHSSLADQLLLKIHPVPSPQGRNLEPLEGSSCVDGDDMATKLVTHSPIKLFRTRAVVDVRITMTDEEAGFLDLTTKV
jgi:hypothetical protein